MQLIYIRHDVNRFVLIPTSGFTETRVAVVVHQEWFCRVLHIEREAKQGSFGIGCYVLGPKLAFRIILKPSKVRLSILRLKETPPFNCPALV